MTDKPCWIENAEHYEIDLGYAILANGDVITSDGLPRGSFDEDAWPATFGKPLTFRKPTAEELPWFTGQSSSLAKAFGEFKEIDAANKRGGR